MQISHSKLLIHRFKSALLDRKREVYHNYHLVENSPKFKCLLKKENLILLQIPYILLSLFNHIQVFFNQNFILIIYKDLNYSIYED